MQKIKLKNFKAFNDDIVIQLDHKNMLLYGENGAGKSSIFESLKTVFFHHVLDSHITAATPEDKEQQKKDFWGKLNNRAGGADFVIEVNDTEYKVFDKTNYQAYMISLDEIRCDDRIYLKELLQRFKLDIDDIDSICTVIFKEVQDEVNLVLKSFNESVSIIIDEEDNYAIRIIDSPKHIDTKTEIKKYFNEAKLNTISLLIVFNLIIISNDSRKNRILVLDDFITSLDASNRTFFIRYILEKFKDFQIIILTHNISFYNLVLFTINNISDNARPWIYANLYEINNEHKLYIKSEIESVDDIQKDFNAGLDIDAIGNRIRKKFEVLLYEYSKLLMVGAVEESKQIIVRILNSKTVYYKDGYKASDLIESIERMLRQQSLHNLAPRIQAKIDDYKKVDFANLQKITKELRLYQKVTMHPMSHGVAGMPTFTTKEIKTSIELLKQIEGFIEGMIDANVSVI